MSNVTVIFAFVKRVSLIGYNLLEFTDSCRMIIVEYDFFKLIYAKIIKRKGYIWS